MPRLRLLVLPVLLACTGAPKPLPEPEDTGCVATLWYKDTDGDGVGDASRGTSSACSVPDGYAAADGDCDDLDDLRYPGASETCDGEDEDCDGAVDEDATDVTTWYVDADGDTFGAGEPAHSCDPPADSASNGDDCDDADPYTSPASSERCGGGDEDCDGAVDEDDARDAPTWFADADADGYGNPDIYEPACAQPDGFTADYADCDDTSSDVSPVGTETCDGRDEDCDGSVDDGETADSPTWYLDRDGDGHGDASVTRLQCAAPDGYVAAATDCDDTSADVSPDGVETCDGRDENCDGAVDETGTDAPTWYADADSDGYGDALVTHAACVTPAGYVADATDCDDTSSDVSPAGTETCDEVDQDCDGEVDEGGIDAPTWCMDRDSDGYGDVSVIHVSCVAPSGYVADATDCDDTSPDVSPAAPETCDGVDQDCDTVVDNDPTDGTTWYRDADIDGRGDPTTTAYACDRPTGYIADDTDCDDAVNVIHPGAPDDCLTALEEDCDPTSSIDGSFNCTDWYEDADGDGYGGDGICTCEPQGGYTLTETGDCDDADPDAWPGAPELWGDGVDQACDGSADNESWTDVTWVVAGTTAQTRLGYALASPGDTDGDGRNDLFVSATGSLSGTSDGGTVYLFTRLEDGMTPGDAAITIEGSGTYDLFGHQLAAGDLDGDGVADLLAGARYSARAGGQSGAAWLFLGPFTADRTSDDAATIVDADEQLRSLGSAVALLGDVDGDGLTDWGLGEAGDDSGGGAAGAIHVFSGVTATSTADASAHLYGDRPGEVVGMSLVGLGDVDGDGFDDLATGSPYNQDGTYYGGAVYVALGPPTTGDADVVSDVVLHGTVNDYLGQTVAAASDCDGDGLADLIVGAPGTWYYTGEVHVFVDVASVRSLADAWASFEGARNGYLGDDVADAGDMDGDGTHDLALGETFGGSGLGAVHVYAGCPSGTHDLTDVAMTLSGTTDSALGSALIGVGDTDGDGLDDLAAGAPYASGVSGWFGVVGWR